MLRGCQPKAKLYDGVTRIHLPLLLSMLAVSLCATEIDSDPKHGQAMPALEVKDLTGQHEGKARGAVRRVASERDQHSARAGAIQKAVE